MCLLWFHKSICAGVIVVRTWMLLRPANSFRKRKKFCWWKKTNDERFNLENAENGIWPFEGLRLIGGEFLVINLRTELKEKVLNF